MRGCGSWQLRGDLSDRRRAKTSPFHRSSTNSRLHSLIGHSCTCHDRFAGSELCPTPHQMRRPPARCLSSRIVHSPSSSVTSSSRQLCRAIFKRYQARQKNHDWASSQQCLHFFLFAILAVLSLGATWYYMFAFFAHSYRNWEQTGGGLHPQGIDLSLLSRLEM